MSMHKNKNEHLTLEEARGEGLKRTELKKKALILREGLRYVRKVNFAFGGRSPCRVVQPALARVALDECVQSFD